MTEHESTTDRSFLVVVNHEEQYSVWAADRQVPDGWRAEGFTGTREQCLDHVERIWTDMRPLSLRRRMAEQDS
ncbi:MbtH family protein [Salinispora pacifica]|uniref:MbtH family protein n=1 Tax=Salinispora pacifica TaxID=351187 RepID=UPI0004895955|nr:MbtH family protein [Salinispora pacifica]